MKFRSLVVAGAAATALCAAAPSAFASCAADTTGSCSDTAINATVASGQKTIAVVNTGAMVLSHITPGVAVSAVTATYTGTTSTDLTMTADTANSNAKMIQCDATGAATPSGKVLTNAMGYSLVSAIATPSSWNGGAVTLASGTGVLAKTVYWTQSLADADNVLTGEHYCLTVDYAL